MCCTWKLQAEVFNDVSTIMVMGVSESPNSIILYVFSHTTRLMLGFTITSQFESQVVIYQHLNFSDGFSSLYYLCSMDVVRAFPH